MSKSDPNGNKNQTSGGKEAQAVPTIDLEQNSWQEIKQAASESPWIPKEHYFQSDWVSDVCRFLREPEASKPNTHVLQKGLPLPLRDLAVTGADRSLAYVLTGTTKEDELVRVAQYIRQHVNAALEGYEKTILSEHGGEHGAPPSLSSHAPKSEGGKTEDLEEPKA